MGRSWLLRVDDMLAAIEHIKTILETGDGSIVSRLAFERSFEILSEASRHVPPDVKARHPTIPWQALADLGNIVRHAYDRVSLSRLQETARRDVPPLKYVLLVLRRDGGASS